MTTETGPIYISEDGYKFGTKEDCMYYEVANKIKTVQNLAANTHLIQLIYHNTLSELLLKPELLPILKYIVEHNDTHTQ